MNNLCFYVQEISKVDDSIHENKLSVSQVQALWALIDIHRKGHLDLNDIYELAGNVTEEQLFAIFKWLDAQMTGSLTLASLQESLGDRQSTSKNHQKEYLFPKFYKTIDSVKDRPKMINQIKSNFNFTEEYLRNVYQSVCNLIQSKFISQGELITVFKSQFIKNQLPWSDSIEKLLKTMVPPNNISEAKFIECFCSRTNKNNEYKQEEECLLNDISTTTYAPLLRAYSSVKTNAQSQSKEVFYLHKNNEKRQSQNIEKRQSHKVVRPPTYNNFVTNQTSFIPQAQTRCQGSPIRQFSTLANESNINDVLSNIRQRRQKLREDSKDRKQLIDNVLQRKRQLCGLNDTRKNEVSPVQYSEAPHDFRFSNPPERPAKTYLNPHHKFINSEDMVKEIPIYRPQELTSHYHTFVPTQSKNTSSALHYLNKSNSQPKFENDGRSIFTDFRTAKQQTLKSNYSKNFDINEILKRYSTKNVGESPKNAVQTPEMNSYRPFLSKCKSGAVLENQQNTTEANKHGKYYNVESFLSKSKNVSQNNSLSVLTGNGNGNGNYKQNVLKRAEEEATKKIEEIERKARMKVLQKKSSGFRLNKEQRQWGKLVKNYRPNN